jgi:hypothetical protein
MKCLFRQDGGDIFSGGEGDTPIMSKDPRADPPTQQAAAAEAGRAGQAGVPSEAPGPDRKGADLRNDAAEEERRQKLRQV